MSWVPPPSTEGLPGASLLLHCFNQWGGEQVPHQLWATFCILWLCSTAAQGCLQDWLLGRESWVLVPVQLPTACMDLPDDLSLPCSSDSYQVGLNDFILRSNVYEMSWSSGISLSLLFLETEVALPTCFPVSKDRWWGTSRGFIAPCSLHPGFSASLELSSRQRLKLQTGSTCRRWCLPFGLCPPPILIPALPSRL